MRIIAVLMTALSVLLAGCSGIQMKDGEFVVGKDTTAAIEDLGVASISKQF